jgi:hypothetical protein
MEMGYTPVFSDGGLVLALAGRKSHVKMNFFQGRKPTGFKQALEGLTQDFLLRPQIAIGLFTHTAQTNLLSPPQLFRMASSMSFNATISSPNVSGLLSQATIARWTICLLSA